MSSSLASARRGRPNGARNDDHISIVGDFRDLIRDWQREQRDARRPWLIDASADLQYRLLEGEQQPEYTLTIDGINKLAEYEVIQLTDDLRIPDGTRIKRAPVTCYRVELTCESRGKMIDSRCICIDADQLTANVLEAPLADDSQIAEALNWRPPAPVAPPAPVYRRLARQPGDSALGFTLGKDERPIRLSAPITWQAFHLASAQIVGRLSIALDISPLVSPKPVLRLFTADGTQVLEVELANANMRFDAIRLQPGDHLLVIGSQSSLEGRGCQLQHSGSCAELSERPQLDNLLPGSGAPIPKIEFGA